MKALRYYVQVGIYVYYIYDYVLDIYFFSCSEKYGALKFIIHFKGELSE